MHTAARAKALALAPKTPGHSPRQGRGRGQPKAHPPAEVNVEFIDQYLRGDHNDDVVSESVYRRLSAEAQSCARNRQAIAVFVAFQQVQALHPASVVFAALGLLSLGAPAIRRLLHSVTAHVSDQVRCGSRSKNCNTEPPTHCLLCPCMQLKRPSPRCTCCAQDLLLEQFHCTAFQCASGMQVMGRHKEWRPSLIQTALELTKEQSFSAFIWQLCQLCCFVQDTSAAICNLRAERKCVNFSSPDYGRFTALQCTDPSLKQVLQAMDQTAGIDDPDIAIRVALKLGLFFDSIKAMAPAEAPSNSPLHAPDSPAAADSSLQHQVDALSKLHEMENRLKVMTLQHIMFQLVQASWQLMSPRGQAGCMGHPDALTLCELFH